MKNVITLTAFFLALFVILNTSYSIGAEEPLPSDSAPQPEIESFDMFLENRTDSYFLEIGINGSVSGKSDQVNLSLLIRNETEKLDGLWLEPMESGFIFYEVRLEGVGPSEDPWSRWEFYFMVDIPKSDNLPEILELVAGEDIDLNLTDPNMTLDPEEVDTDELARQLSELKIELIARALSGNGTYGEDRMDITMEVVGELTSFFIDNGGGTEDDDQDEEEITEKEKDDGDWVLYVIISTGMIAVILIILVLILIVSLRKK